MPTIVTSGGGTRAVVVPRQSTVTTAGAGNVVTVTRRDTARGITERSRTLAVGTTGPQGPKGDPGLPGAGGDSIAVVRLAAQALGGHRIVRSVGDGAVDYADATTAAHGDHVLGLTIGAASAGANVQVLTSGPITEPSWNWTPGEPLFLVANGLLSHTPLPGAAFDLCVGFAETPTTVFLDLDIPLFAAEA